MKIFLILFLTLTQIINLTRLRQEKSDKLENHSGNYKSPTVPLSHEESLNGHHASKTYIQTITSNKAPYNNAYAFQYKSEKNKPIKFDPTLAF